MRIGMVGLGRMGANMTVRLLQHGHEVVAYDRNPGAVRQATAEGATGAGSLEDLVDKLQPPRGVWVMVPAGAPTDDTVDALGELLKRGDTIIDGGNSKWTDSMRRAAALEPRGINFLDAGTSGGIWGLKVGYSLMIGGPEDAYKRWEPIFAALAPKDGYGRVGPAGAGHFVKMVHNGIEYGLLEAYGEGYEILQASKFNLDLHAIARNWNHGSVVRSWINELAEDAFAKNPTLEGIKDWVADSGEGPWTVEAAIDTDVPAHVLTLSLLERFRSRQEASFAAKVIAVIRNEFGGHEVKTE